MNNQVICNLKFWQGGTIWFGVHKRNSSLFWFLFQMEMPRLPRITHFLVNRNNSAYTLP